MCTEVRGGLRKDPVSETQLDRQQSTLQIIDCERVNGADER